MKKAFIILISIFIISCNQESPTSPEGVLSYYVHKRFKGSTMEDLKEHLTSGMLDKLSAIKDTKYEDLKDFRKKQFKVISKSANCASQNTCNITYYISYLEEASGKKKYDTETKKIATLVKDGEKWKIDSIDHIKTYHDMIDKLDVSSEN